MYYLLFCQGNQYGAQNESLNAHYLIENLSSDVLASLCVANKEKLELKIDNVVFLCSQSILRINQVTFNVVFALKSPLPRPVIRCYQSLSLAISKALLIEEANSQYLTYQSKILHDSMDQHQAIDENNRPIDTSFSYALQNCKLAQELEAIYESIKSSGIVQIMINNNVNLSFCLPHLAYKITDKFEQTYFVDVIFEALKYLKPYLGILLLSSRESILKSLPINCNSYVRALVEIYNPRFTFARYAAELDVSIDQVYTIIGHLIYWAKCKVVYPICELNVYVLNPNTTNYFKLADDFNLKFGDRLFYYVLSQFSSAKPLVDHLDPSMPREIQANIVEQVIWLLQRNVLMQLHSYLFLMPKKVEHQRLTCDNFYSKISEYSIDEETEFIEPKGSEKSNDSDILEQKDLTLVYDEYRQLFTQNRISEKDQQYIFKAFDQKSEHDKKLFIQLFKYLNGQFNFEEIMFHEKLTRSDLLTFLDKFKDLIMVSCYEDPNPIVRINVKLN